MNYDVKFEFEGMLFTWDENKAAVNWKKHKVTFSLWCMLNVLQRMTETFTV